MASTQTSQHGQAIAEPGHGHSVAAWSGVAIILLGALISCIAIVNYWWVVFGIGLVVALVGAVVWKVLLSAGYGEKPHGH